LEEVLRHVKLLVANCQVQRCVLIEVGCACHCGLA
jgi:hypothetical protein